jgi:YidC/Oxa1 family membrane protein insertase
MEWINIPFGYLMKLCLAISSNYYILALFFFAVIMQIVLIPLGIKQHKSQVMQRKLRPKEMAIRKKYAGRKDKATQQKMQLEVQEMYRNEGYNQLSGCLPMLIQLPIILILFGIVRNPISYSSTEEMKNQLQSGALYKEAIAIVEQYKHEDAIVKEEGEDYNGYVDELNKVLTELGAKLNTETNEYEYNHDQRKVELSLTKIITEDRDYFTELAAEHNLSLQSGENTELGFSDEQREALPNFTFFGDTLLNIPRFGDITSFNLRLIHLIPLLIFITSYFGGVINRKYMGAPAGADGNPMGGGKFMEWGMPVLSTVFSFSFPAAIGVYWIWRTITGAVQPIVLNRFYPMPVITKEDLDAAEKEAKKKKKKKVITIEVDEDDDSYRDIEVNGNQYSGKKQSTGGGSEKTGKKNTGKSKTFTVNNVEMLSADDDDNEGESENK